MPDCELEIGCSDAESIQDYEQATVVNEDPALKCYECGRPIPVGTEVECVTGTCEGEEIDWRTCMDCAAIAEAFSEEGRMHGGLWDSMQDYGFENFTTGCLTRMQRASAKAYLVERWRKWKGLDA